MLNISMLNISEVAPPVETPGNEVAPLVETLGSEVAPPGGDTRQ